MKFAYTALSIENKKLTGILESDSVASAQEDLHKMGLSIISVMPISDAEYERKREEEKQKKAAEGIMTFNFKGMDTQGKSIEGTIDAPSPYEAYQRLVIEFQFKVEDLVRTDSSEAEKTEMRSLLPAFADRLKKSGEKKVKTDEEELAEVEYETNSAIIAEIDAVIQNTKDILSRHKDFFSFEQLTEVEGTLGELERIRTSNNLKHIAEVSNHLYDLIRTPKKATKEQMGGQTDFQESLGMLKENKLVKKEIGEYKKKILFKEVQIIFQKVMRRLRKIATAKVISTEEMPAEETTATLPEEPKDWKEKMKQVLSIAAEEIESFMGWLLAFYILYFFLAGLSLEKGIGLPASFVFGTLKSNLLLSITLFLLITHLVFKIRSLALGILGYGIFGFILFNF